MATRIFLAVVGIIYAGLAAWCTLRPRTTAENIGYRLPTNSALSEYIVVYGGLEAGLAIFLFLAVFNPGLATAAVWLVFVMHACLALFRLGTIIFLSDLTPLIHMLFAVELTLTVTSAYFAFKRGLPA